MNISESYRNIDPTIYGFIIPNKENLLAIPVLTEYKLIISELAHKYSQNKAHLTINCKDLSVLKEHLEVLYKLSFDIEKHILTFTQSKPINDYRNNLTQWKNKLSQTNVLLSGLTDELLRQFDRDVEIKYPQNRTLIQLKHDAQILRNYLKEGHNLTGIFFALKKAFINKKVREVLYFIKEAQINGKPCNTTTGFETLLTDIKIKQDFEELENTWGICLEDNVKTRLEKVKYFRQIKQDTETIINLIYKQNATKELMESLSDIRVTSCESKILADLIIETCYANLITQQEKYERNISKVKKYLSIQNIHQIANDLINAITEVNVEQYEKLLCEIDTLDFEDKKYANYKKIEHSLKENLPLLTDDILKGTIEISKLPQLKDAIYFKNALNKIRKYLDKNLEAELTYKLSELEKQEEKYIGEIASKKAWFYILERLKKDKMLRQHLQAWVDAVKEIGKTGTGKKAKKFMKVAQSQMEKCKNSVPCWVMPMYKVAETVTPEQGMYDYVIIDEASQLGPEDIFNKLCQV